MSPAIDIGRSIMSNPKNLLRRLIAWGALSVVLVAGALSVSADSSGSSTITKAERNYEIALVFDNSGSMYENNKNQLIDAWCHAKYAMEIFATMLDYDNGDRLRIFPMWEVSTDGVPVGPLDYRKHGLNEQTAPVLVNSLADISKIHNMNTLTAGPTPIDPIDRAYNYLRSSGATDRWIIVLTDGVFSQENGNSFNKNRTGAYLSERCNEDIQMFYLPFGDGAPLKLNTPGYHTIEGNGKLTSKNLQKELLNICNLIFKRAELKGKLHDGKLKLDLSMRKLILFAHGENAKITSLTAADGTVVPVTQDSGQRTYSTVGTADSRYYKAPFDDSLAGQVVTFGDCAAGEYTLNYSGADTVSIFYEPDVDIRATLTDENGNTVDLSKGDVMPGKYVLNYTIVDNKTGKEATDSPLLGNVNLEATVQQGDGAPAKVENGGVIELMPNDDTKIRVTGTYLDDYTIKSEGAGLFPDSFKVKLPDASKLKVSVDVQQPQDWYRIGKEDGWKPIRVDVTYDGKPLSDDEMKALNVTVPPIEGVPFTYEIAPGESAFLVHIGKQADGTAATPATGSYVLDFEATTVDKYGRQIKGSDYGRFQVQTYSPFLWLYILLALLALLLIIYIIYKSGKALPKNAIPTRCVFYLRGREAGVGEATYDRRGRTIIIKSPMMAADPNLSCNATFQLYPVDTRWKRSSSRRIGISGITSGGMGVNEIFIDGTSYTRNGNGPFVNPTAPEDPIREETVNPTFTIKTRTSRLECEFEQI